MYKDLCSVHSTPQILNSYVGEEGPYKHNEETERKEAISIDLLSIRMEK